MFRPQLPQWFCQGLRLEGACFFQSHGQQYKRHYLWPRLEPAVIKQANCRFDVALILQQVMEQLGCEKIEDLPHHLID